MVPPAVRQRGCGVVVGPRREQQMQLSGTFMLPSLQPPAFVALHKGAELMEPNMQVRAAAAAAGRCALP